MANPVIIGEDGILTRVQPSDTLTVGSGITTETGNLTIDSFAGYIAINPIISTNLIFDNNPHEIIASTAVDNTNGVNLMVSAAGGGNTSTSLAAGNGGIISLQGGGGGAAGISDGVAGNGGNATIIAGSGGDGTATGVAGAGGDVSIAGGGAGANNGFGGANGGNVDIDGGIGSGAGVNGVLTIGVHYASSLTIGNSQSISANGIWTFSSPITGSITNVTDANVYGCDSGVTVGTPVYISASDFVSMADATSAGTGPAIGIIANKPTPTTCYICMLGVVSGYSGLTGASTYFLAIGGGITKIRPSSTGNIVQQIGVARNGTTLLVNLGQQYTII